MLSSEVVSVDKDTDEGNAVESLRFEDEDSCCLLELLPFDKLFTLESGKFMKYVINYKVLDDDRIHFFYTKENYLSAYLSVLRVCSHDPVLGEMHDIITVRESPTNESLRTSVSLLPLKGM